MPTIPFNPSWKKYEDKISSDNAKEARNATEMFTAERNHELNVDPQARKWEEGRKKAIAEQKPAWKKSEIKKQQEEAEKPIKRLLNAGKFDYGLKPTAGHILIGLEDTMESVTDSGIFLASVTNESPNIGTVLAIGDSLVCKHCFAEARFQSVKDVEQFIDVLVGQKVLFKRGAGLEVTVKENKARIMAFSDILGVFEDD